MAGCGTFGRATLTCNEAIFGFAGAGIFGF
jgi:hypothetical protein